MPYKLVDLWNSVPHEDKNNEAFQIVYTKEEIEEAINNLLSEFKEETEIRIMNTELQEMGFDTGCKVTKIKYLTKERVIKLKKELGLE